MESPVFPLLLQNISWRLINMFLFVSPQVYEKKRLGGTAKPLAY